MVARRYGEALLVCRADYLRRGVVGAALAWLHAWSGADAAAAIERYGRGERASASCPAKQGFRPTCSQGLALDASRVGGLALPQTLH